MSVERELHFETGDFYFPEIDDDEQSSTEVNDDEDDEYPSELAKNVVKIYRFFSDFLEVTLVIPTITFCEGIWEMVVFSAVVFYIFLTSKMKSPNKQGKTLKASHLSSYAVESVCKESKPVLKNDFPVECFLSPRKDSLDVSFEVRDVEVEKCVSDLLKTVEKQLKENIFKAPLNLSKDSEIVEQSVKSETQTVKMESQTVRSESHRVQSKKDCSIESLIVFSSSSDDSVKTLNSEAKEEDIQNCVSEFLFDLVTEVENQLIFEDFVEISNDSNVKSVLLQSSKSQMIPSDDELDFWLADSGPVVSDHSLSFFENSLDNEAVTETDARSSEAGKMFHSKTSKSRSYIEELCENINLSWPFISKFPKNVSNHTLDLSETDEMFFEELNLGNITSEAQKVFHEEVDNAITRKRNSISLIPLEIAQNLIETQSLDAVISNNPEENLSSDEDLSNCSFHSRTSSPIKQRNSKPDGSNWVLKKVRSKSSFEDILKKNLAKNAGYSMMLEEEIVKDGRTSMVNKTHSFEDVPLTSATASDEESNPSEISKSELHSSANSDITLSDITIPDISRLDKDSSDVKKKRWTMKSFTTSFQNFLIPTRKAKSTTDGASEKSDISNLESNSSDISSHEEKRSKKKRWTAAFVPSFQNFKPFSRKTVSDDSDRSKTDLDTTTMSFF